MDIEMARHIKEYVDEYDRYTGEADAMKKLHAELTDIIDGVSELRLYAVRYGGDKFYQAVSKSHALEALNYLRFHFAQKAKWYLKVLEKYTIDASVQSVGKRLT